MAGRTAKEAARELGVELTTVRTHQYRAFRRLGIRSQKELLRGAPAPSSPSAASAASAASVQSSEAASS
jgi:DNA-binding NarL/FixJ family response regulator